MYFDVMTRYRLGKNATNPLKDYIETRSFVIMSVAEKVGITNQSLHNILNGTTKRPKRENLEKLASVIGATLKFDSEGAYFEPCDEEDNEGEIKIEIDDPWVEELLPYLKEMGEEERRSLESIVKVLSQKSKIK